ncbi:MAG: hypothetical protein O6947_04850 [Acidobacteria bacterium]|nr:hypothetical protein [Acidobacteriota bacterium]
MKGRRMALFALVTVFLLALLLIRGIQFPPDIPFDLDHRRGQIPGDCLSCHGPDERFPRGKNHPLVDECFQCHSWPAAGGR